MASTLSAEMAFEIGEMVYFRAATWACGHVPKRFVVTERIVQECHGGVQRQYRLGDYKTNGWPFVAEIELTRELPEPDAAAIEMAAKLERDAEESARETRWKARWEAEIDRMKAAKSSGDDEAGGEADQSE